MNPSQKFFLVVAMIGGLILYVAGYVLMKPPVHAVLLSKTGAVVTMVTVETRAKHPDSLPVVDVRLASGDVVLVKGFQWMAQERAREIIAQYRAGRTVTVIDYKNGYWNNLRDIRTTVWLFVSTFGAFIALFGLWMVRKTRLA